MTLKEFKDSFPDIYKQYEASSYSRYMSKEPIDRMIYFIEFNDRIRLINITHETKELYRPLIKIDGKEKKYNTWLSLNECKSFLVGKALEYLSTGRIY